MSYENYNVHNPKPTKGHALYAVPLRLINDIISIRVSDIPEKYQKDFAIFVSRGEAQTLLADTVPYSLFGDFCNHIIIE